MMQKKILILEDEIEIAEVYTEYLVSKGHETVIASNGLEGLEKLKDFIPNLILLDLNMPKITGKEVLEKIKTDPDLENMPVIVVTNSDYKKDMIECYRLRADGYLQKPADFKKLVDFFISVKESIKVKNKLSIYYIEKVYDELRLAV